MNPFSIAQMGHATWKPEISPSLRPSSFPLTSPGLSAICFSFPSRPIPLTSPFPSVILSPSPSYQRKTVSLREGTIIFLLRCKGWLSCSALTINSDLDMKGEEERTEGEKRELGPDFSSRRAPGRVHNVIPSAPETKPACRSRQCE